jgi:hypothetical protein
LKSLEQELAELQDSDGESPIVEKKYQLQLLEQQITEAQLLRKQLLQGIKTPVINNITTHPSHTTYKPKSTTSNSKLLNTKPSTATISTTSKLSNLQMMAKNLLSEDEEEDM